MRNRDQKTVRNEKVDKTIQTTRLSFDLQRMNAARLAQK